MEDYPARVTLYDDGIFRWSYDMDMWKNRFMLKLIMKVIGIVCVVLFAFIIIALGPSAISPMLILIVLLILGGAFAVTLLIYGICALVMHGTYHLCFEMDESAVVLVRKPATKNALDAMGVIAVVAGIAAGKSGEAMRVGATLAAANAVGTTYFSSVRRVKQHPEYDVINLKEFFGMNQIYVNPEDYAAVCEFILAHVRDRARG